jgi:hypothetical protein
MQRRDFFKAIAAVGAVTGLGGTSIAAPTGWRRFEITYRLNLQAQKAPARV